MTSNCTGTTSALISRAQLRLGLGLGLIQCLMRPHFLLPIIHLFETLPLSCNTQIIYTAQTYSKTMLMCKWIKMPQLASLLGQVTLIKAIAVLAMKM